MEDGENTGFVAGDCGLVEPVEISVCEGIQAVRLLGAAIGSQLDHGMESVLVALVGGAMQRGPLIVVPVCEIGAGRGKAAGDLGHWPGSARGARVPRGEARRIAVASRHNSALWGVSLSALSSMWFCAIKAP